MDEHDKEFWKSALTLFPEDRQNVHFVRLLAPETCADLLAARIDEEWWIRGKVGPQPHKPSRECSLIYEGNQPALLAKVRGELQRALTPLLTKNGETLLKLSHLQFIRYREREHFAMHRDANPDGASWRRYSFVCYLNDDYAGGATYFPNLDLSVRPTVGYAALFPSHYVHEGRSIEAGMKYVINAFLVYPDSTEESPY